MDKDAIAFLDGETVDEPEVTEVEEAPQEPEQTEEPKAEAQEPEAEQVGENEGEPPAPEPEQKRDVPVTALLDEREKRQEAQRKAEEADRIARESAERTRQLEAQLRELQKPKEEAPDWYENPQEAAQYHNRTIEQQFRAQMMQQSKFFAERDFGAETVNEAIAYFDRNPAASQQFMNHPSPFHAAVDFYKRQKAVEEIGTDPEAYRQKMREELRAELEAEYKQNAGTSQQSKPKAPPPSMASAPSSGQGGKSPGNGFDALFPE